MSLLAPEDIGSSDPIQPPVPFSQRISYSAQIRAVQLAYSAATGISRKLYATSKPTQTKSYPCRPRLENHIFLPAKYNESKELLPLYLDIHGGGYCIGSPADDDDFCSAFSEHFNIIVVSVNYSKAPQNPYPAAINDIVAIAEAIINDSTLRIDKNRVAIGGWSAGGALSLAVCQIPRLRGVIKACCPVYPPTDLSNPATEKLKTRAWRDEEKGVDMLVRPAALFDHAYINPGTRLKDPKISPLYAEKSDLPEWVFIIGAEFDILCFEGRVLACKLGGLEIPNGREGKDDESGLEEKYGWEREGGKIKWLMARGLNHGFATSIPFAKTTDEKEKARKEKFREVWLQLGEWLFKGPFAT